VAGRIRRDYARRPAPSAGQHFPQRIGKLPRFLDEATVAAWELNCLRAKPLGEGEGEGGAVRKLTAGAGADPDDDSCGRRCQGADIGHEARGGRKVVAEKARAVPGPLVQRLASWDRGPLFRIPMWAMNFPNAAA
jgi:hypothetical protein